MSWGLESYVTSTSEATSFQRLLSVGFHGTGLNYGFVRANLNRINNYCAIYRVLKKCLDHRGARSRISFDRQEVRITDINGPVDDRETATIFTRDIVSYYKFNLGFKYVAICIDADRPQKTGIWFLTFDQEKQLAAFCGCLYWLFGRGPESASQGVDYAQRNNASWQPRQRYWSRPSPGSNGSELVDSGAEDEDYEEDPMGEIEPKQIILPPRPRKVGHPRYSPPVRGRRRNFRRY